MSMNFRILRNCKSLQLQSYRKLSSLVPQTKDGEYVDEPKYPPIFDPTYKGALLLDRMRWYDLIRRKPTVDEKLIEFCDNIDRFKFKSFKLTNGNIAYRELDFLQHCTRTHIIEELPEIYEQMQVDHLAQRLREPLLEAVLLEKFYLKVIQKPSNVFSRILHTMFSSLGSENKQLNNVEVITKPRNESFWWHTDYKEMPSKINMCFQFMGSPSSQLRIPTPLAPIVDRDDPLCTASDVPVFNYSPRTLGKSFVERIITMVPGFWNGDTCEFPFLHLNTLKHLSRYISNSGNRNLDEVIKGSAVLELFGWLLGIAANQGFTPFHELTYPITTQSIFTNGKTWHFFVYQLNSIAFHPDVYKGTHRNLMWYSGPMRLYEGIEDGTLKGVNDDVLKLLIKFFLHKAPEKIDFELKPYCGEDTRPLEERAKLRADLHYYYDNRPRMVRHNYEVPTWHHVYKYNKHAPPSPRVKMW